jgi:small basic protein (TIGR04137 family)
MNPVLGDGIMTQHASLKSANKITAKRNVMKRFERIDFLRASGKWKEGDRGLGLPKTKPQV